MESFCSLPQTESISNQWQASRLMRILLSGRTRGLNNDVIVCERRS